MRAWEIRSMTLDLKSISHVTKTKRTLDRSRCGHGDVHRTKTKLTLFFIMCTRAVCSVRPLVWLWLLHIYNIRSKRWFFFFVFKKYIKCITYLHSRWKKFKWILIDLTVTHFDFVCSGKSVWLFWSGNTLPRLKAFSVIQSHFDSSSEETGRESKTGPCAVIIFTFLSIFLLPSGSESNESKGIATKRNVHLKLKAVEKHREGSTYRWIEASIRLQMEAEEDSQSCNSRCIFYISEPWSLKPA